MDTFYNDREGYFNSDNNDNSDNDDNSTIHVDDTICPK